jgi:hypothetical protein
VVCSSAVGVCGPRRQVCLAVWFVRACACNTASFSSRSCARRRHRLSDLNPFRAACQWVNTAQLKGIGIAEKCPHLKPFSRVCTIVPYPSSAKACAIDMGSGTSPHVPRFTGFDHRH